MKALRKKIQAKDAIQIWIRFIEDYRSPRTLKLYRMVIRQFADTLPAKIKLRSITQEHIEDYLKGLPDYYSNSTINTYLAGIWSFFHYCTDRFDLPSPAAKIKRLPVTEQNQNIITEAEYQQILEACDPQERAAIELLAHTGLRANYEFPQALCPANITNGMLHIIGKGNKKRVIPLNRTAKATIETLLSYPNFSKTLTRRNHLYYLCERLNRRTKIKKFSPHSFRHFFADSLRKKGAPIHIISRLLGHSSIKITEQIYQHWTTDELRGSTDILE